MDFQTSLTEHVLTLATAVVSEATSHQLQENNILDQVKRIFQGRLKTTTSDSTLLSGSSEKNEEKQPSLNASACFEQKYDDNKEQYYVFIVLSDEVFSASPHTTPAPLARLRPAALSRTVACTADPRPRLCAHRRPEPPPDHPDGRLLAYHSRAHRPQSRRGASVSVRNCAAVGARLARRLRLARGPRRQSRCGLIGAPGRAGSNG